MQTIISASGGEGIAQVALRLPFSLREFIKAEAKAKGRSMNTHIVMCLGERKATAGDSFGDQAPAVEGKSAAL